MMSVISTPWPRSIAELARLSPSRGRLPRRCDRSMRPSSSASESRAEDNLFTYDLACGLALYGEIAGQDRSVPGQDSNKNSMITLTRRWRFLRQAVDRGWRNADWTERDPELSSLRARPDFQALLKTLRTNSKTSAPGQ